MKKYFQLIGLMLKYGTLRKTGQNFNEERENAIGVLGLDSVGPVNTQKKVRGNTLLAQAAFIKSSFNNVGGHLGASALAYIRIPKSGNTSLSYALLTKNYPELISKSLTDLQINFLADVNLKPAEDADTELFFTVVRDPFKRLVSVYRDFFDHNHPSFIYQDYLFGILQKEISFAEFVQRVSKIPDRLKDQHLKPQHYFLKPYHQKKIPVTCFHLEEPGKLKAFLANHDLELVHRNKSGEAYDYATYYTPALLEQVYTIYRTDIEKLGYTPAYESLKSRI